MPEAEAAPGYLSAPSSTVAAAPKYASAATAAAAADNNNLDAPGPPHGIEYTRGAGARAGGDKGQVKDGRKPRGPKAALADSAGVRRGRQELLRAAMELAVMRSVQHVNIVQVGCGLAWWVC